MKIAFQEYTIEMKIIEMDNKRYKDIMYNR